MGGACQCLNNRDDGGNLDIEKDKSGNQGKKIAKTGITPEDEKKYAANIAKIIKIQSCYRGHAARAKLGPEFQKRGRGTVDGQQMQVPVRREIDVIPDYSNPETRATEQRLGPFKYDSPPDDMERDLETKGPFELDNEAIYVGQWTKNGLRHGKGVQTWPDGSKYEGYWKNDMANGKGRLIHADGDVYEGDWVDDKAHGVGTYTHMD